MLAGVQGTAVVLDAARRAGVRRVVFAASSAAYGDTPTLPKVETMPPNPLSPYAVSKLAGEHLMRVFAQLYGLEAVSLRYFNVFGPRQDPKSEYAAVIPKFITAGLRKERPIVFGDGEQTRDFCHIDNAVRANLLAASTSRRLSGEVLNVACGERTSLNELLRYVGDLTGGPLTPEHRDPRPGDVRDSLADVSAARDLLGYVPTVSLREGLARTVEAFRQQQRAR
jgi:UDP-glucose 4-epimerase